MKTAPRLHARYVALLVAVSVLAGAIKIRRAPEWTVLTGTVAERQDICRSVYKKSPGRAAWCLQRLLADRSPAVRIPAIEALALRPDLHHRLADTIRHLADDEYEHVRARALVYILQHNDMVSRAWLDQARTELDAPASRERHPQLLSSYLSAELDRGNAAPVAWVVGLIEANPDEDCHSFHPLLRYPDRLGPLRDRLVACLEYTGQSRHFVVSMLTAIDGEMRGTTAADWRTERASPPPEEVLSQHPLTRFTIEAEWAHRIQPNFQVDVQEGESCISLGEGAGGDHFWRRHEHSTVDIGKAHYVFTLARAGKYQVWCRCWFMDKCGNHSLLHIDDRWLQWRQAGYDDRYDLLRKWHWKRLETDIVLPPGKHTLVLTAGDDGLLYDKLAVLPVEETFDPHDPPPLDCLYDPATPTLVSLTAEMQSQVRGSTQTVTVCVRRGAPQIVTGEVKLSVLPPFQIEGRDNAQIRFRADSALATAEFRVHVPAGVTGGEVKAEAVFAANGAEVAAGSIILGVTYDWLTTGPLDPRDPRCKELLVRSSLSPADLKTGWTPFPKEGHDRYRRLFFEQAYGQMHDKVIFLYTEIEVTQGAEYTSFLTLDDKGYVFIDGERVGGRDEEGVGEGWMLVDKVRLQTGRYPVFAWVYQSNVPEPEGPDAGRHTPNHWTFKWLLRESRHVPATAVRGVPLASP